MGEQRRGWAVGQLGEGAASSGVGGCAMLGRVRAEGGAARAAPPSMRMVGSSRACAAQHVLPAVPWAAGLVHAVHNYNSICGTAHHSWTRFSGIPALKKGSLHERHVGVQPLEGGAVKAGQLVAGRHLQPHAIHQLAHQLRGEGLGGLMTRWR